MDRVEARGDSEVRVARLAASLIRGAKLVVMPAGHAPFAEVPDEFLAEVVPFLERCAGDGRDP